MGLVGCGHMSGLCDAVGRPLAKMGYADRLKATIEGLSALHSSRLVFGDEADARRGNLKGRIGNPEVSPQRTPSIRSSFATRRPAASHSMPTPASPCASMVGRTRSHAHCSTASTGTRSGPSSRFASTGATAPLLSATTRQGGRPAQVSPSAVQLFWENAARYFEQTRVRRPPRPRSGTRAALRSRPPPWYSPASFCRRTPRESSHNRRGGECRSHRC